MNHTVLNGKAIRVMWSTPNREARLSGIGNVFVKVITKKFNGDMYMKTFS